MSISEQNREAIWVKHEQDRKRYNSAILESTSRRKIVAAGPGTGKTLLFQEVCKRTAGSRNLVLTFINELVKDLKEELSQVAEVRTLHSFAYRLLKFLKPKYFMKLTEIIEKDFKFSQGKEISFKDIFSNLKKGYENELRFYSDRRRYYDYFGPFCSIYALIKIFEGDPNKIPTYSQILVDEFQDFNKLEIKLIDFLSNKSPILIVGDDDQSLYSFKHAEPSEIRTRYASDDYESFELPYCSRCPEVLVRTVNKFIQKAEGAGFLKGRIKKEYKYFSSKGKDEISEKNPKITVKRPVYERAVAYHVEMEIKEISESEKKFSVVIICSLFRQIATLAKSLEKKGFRNIQTPPDRPVLTKEDGYKILLRNENSNLGWRILSSFPHTPTQLSNAIKGSISTPTPFQELLGHEERKHVLDILKILQKIRDDKKITQIEGEKVFGEFGYAPFEIVVKKIKDEIVAVATREKSYRNIPIRIVTMLGAKGLSADYVFLVNFDDRFVLDKGTITNENICKFLVALTRAHRRFYIFSAQGKLPTFINWLDEDLYEEQS